MPVTTKHPDYTDLEPIWRQMRDVSKGQRAIHAAAERYLPRLVDETNDKYAARLTRSSFFNATARTITGLAGMVFRVEPTVEVSTAVEPMLEDVTKSGEDLTAFAQQVTNEVLTVNRAGVLVDYPTTSTAGLTVAQAEALNLRPHTALYKTETIINWRYEWINNVYRLTMVVLAESAAIPGKDEFDHATEPRYRVLDLELFDDGSRRYRVRLFRQSPNGKDELVTEPIYPLMSGRNLDYIPFVIIDAADDNLPPLLDLADVNLSHYRSTSDRKHGAHQTALPQPWVTGITPTIGPNGQPINSKLYIGGGDLWTFPKDANVGMLEYTGQGLQTLKEEIEREEAQMAVLGARMLEQQKSGVEAAETAGIHRAGEQSALATLAGAVARQLEKALSWFDMWGGGDGKVSFELNKDYFPASLTPQMILALVQSWQMGAIDKEELFYDLQGGGVIRESTTFEDQEAKITAAGPTLAPGSGNGQ